MSAHENLDKLGTIMHKHNIYKIRLSENGNILEITLSDSKIAQKPIVTESKDLSTKDIYTVKSSMVGVLYVASSPNEPPLIKVGQKIKQGDSLFLIEAMKSFHYVESPVSGVVEKILVTNGVGVEFNEQLVKIKVQ